MSASNRATVSPFNHGKFNKQGIGKTGNRAQALRNLRSSRPIAQEENISLAGGTGQVGGWRRLAAAGPLHEAPGVVEPPRGARWALAAELRPGMQSSGGASARTVTTLGYS